MGAIKAGRGYRRVISAIAKSQRVSPSASLMLRDEAMQFSERQVLDRFAEPVIGVHSRDR
jgi:hypothetical protein